jgi:hypothetical protein
MAKPVYGGGSLPSGKTFDTSEEEKKQAASIRKAAAAKMATDTSAMDVVGDVLPYIGAAVGGYFGGPQGAKAGYEGGKTVGGIIGGNKERAEAVYEQTVEDEMALENPEAVAQMKKAKAEKQKAAQSGGQSDPFAQALSMYEKYQKTQGAE